MGPSSWAHQPAGQPRGRLLGAINSRGEAIVASRRTSRPSLLWLPPLLPTPLHQANVRGGGGGCSCARLLEMQRDDDVFCSTLCCFCTFGFEHSPPSTSPPSQLTILSSFSPPILPFPSEQLLLHHRPTLSAPAGTSQRTAPPQRPSSLLASASRWRRGKGVCLTRRILLR